MSSTQQTVFRPWHKRDSYSFFTINTSAGGLLVPEDIIHPADSGSTLTWFIKYIYYCNLHFLNTYEIQLLKLRFSSARPYPVYALVLTCSQRILNYIWLPFQSLHSAHSLRKLNQTSVLGTKSLI